MTCQSKSPRYKSIVMTNNTSSQALTSTPTPLTLVGTIITNTGVAINPGTSGIEITYPGSFLITADIVFTATTAGLVTLQLYSDGATLPETAITVTVPVGTTAISASTVRRFIPNCQNPVNIQVYANTDGTAVGEVTKVTTKAIKLG